MVREMLACLGFVSIVRDAFDGIGYIVVWLLFITALFQAFSIQWCSQPASTNIAYCCCRQDECMWAGAWEVEVYYRSASIFLAAEAGFDF
jgi:hypothetical protein